MYHRSRLALGRNDHPLPGITTTVLLAAIAAATPGCSSTAAGAAASEAWNFDSTTPGQLPAGFRAAATRRVGPLATWEVRAVADAPSPPQVLSLSYPNHRSYDTFNLCWTDQVQFGDGVLSVRLRAVSGKEDQGGGLIWRARGPDDYYIARLNPLENNLRLYTVQGGNRSMLASADCEATAGRWYELRIEQQGSHITCSVDGTRLIDLDDATFAAAGGIGLWTKADAATDFDDLRVDRGTAPPR